MNIRLHSPNRAQRGFTLIELLVAVVIIGILVAIAIPNFIGTKDRARVAGLKNNMHMTQVAAEAYAVDSTNTYPLTPAELLPYLTGGSNSIGGTPGTRPQNPITGVQNDTIYTEGFTTTAQVVTARSAPPVSGPGSPGQIGYSALDSEKSYAVCGSDANNIRVASPSGGTLVLSNQ